MILASFILLALFALLVAGFRALAVMEKQRGRSTTGPASTLQGTLQDRRITLKACPDCGELVFIAAQTCRYCGYAFKVAERVMPNKTPHSTNPAMTPPAGPEARQP
jgi:predicted RNA-binding Zn-ribbon protein involved in translation (DUF1610 family)